MVALKISSKTIAILCFICLTSCGFRPKLESSFSPDETAHWSKYSQDDIIYFYDAFGKSEKIRIQAMKGRYKKTNLFNMEHEFKIVIDNNNVSQDLFTILKTSKLKNPKITIRFKDFINQNAEDDFQDAKHDPITINGIELSNYYEIENEKFSPSETGIKTIIWTDSKGFTAYQLNDKKWMMKK